MRDQWQAWPACRPGNYLEITYGRLTAIGQIPADAVNCREIGSAISDRTQGCAMSSADEGLVKKRLACAQ